MHNVMRTHCRDATVSRSLRISPPSLTYRQPESIIVLINVCLHNHCMLQLSPRCWTCLVTVSPVWRGWRAYRTSMMSIWRRMRYTSTHMTLLLCTCTCTCTTLRIYRHCFSKFQVVDIREVEHLKGLKLLRALNLSNNPIQVSMLSICTDNIVHVQFTLIHHHKNYPTSRYNSITEYLALFSCFFLQALADYRPTVLFHLGSLTLLDNRKVDLKEKVAHPIAWCCLIYKIIHESNSHCNLQCRLELGIALPRPLKWWHHMTIG